MKSYCVSFLLLMLSVGSVRADDWPMYKGNAARNGFTAKSKDSIIPHFYFHAPANDRGCSDADVAREIFVPRDALVDITGLDEGRGILAVKARAI